MSNDSVIARGGGSPQERSHRCGGDCPICNDQHEQEQEGVSKREVLAYEVVRKSGLTNMFDVRTVQKLSGLKRATIIAIMKNYDALIEKFDIKREED